MIYRSRRPKNRSFPQSVPEHGQQWYRRTGSLQDFRRCGNYRNGMTSENNRPDCNGRTGAIDWRAALAEHDRWLRTVVAARVEEPQAIDEVIQEVSLAAVAQRAPISDPAKIAPWLYRLAVRQALLYRRKQGRRRRLVDRYALRCRAEQNAHAADPLDWLVAAERRQLVRQAIGQLPHRDVEILMLKYVENWSYQQIAERLGLSPAAVESRLHRARARLRAQLQSFKSIEGQK